MKERHEKKSKQTKNTTKCKFQKKNFKIQKRKRSPSPSSGEEQDIEVPYEEESDTLSEVDNTECAGCRESYNPRKKKDC